jgi:cell wall-associated NlpC family hydrolase
MIRGATLLAFLAMVPSLAQAGKVHHARHARKRHRVSREEVRQESIAAWPRCAHRVFQVDPVGVPELDRLAVDRPPLGVSADEPSGDAPPSRISETVEGGRAALSAGLLASMTDPVQKLKAVAEPLLGAPYRSGGSAPKGFDCSGFVLTLIHAMGQSIEGRSSAEFWKQGDPVDRNHLEAGDLLFFSDHHRAIGHVAVYLSDGKFVHASVGSGEWSSPRWTRTTTASTTREPVG